MNRRHFIGSATSVVLSSVLGHSWTRLAFGAETRKLPIARHLIVLWMNGGPSHIDTWDPKSGPTGGSHKAIKTKVSGVQVSEHLPRLAEMADKLAIVRSVTSKEGNHQRAQYMMHTGYSPNPTVEHPSMGAWLSNSFGEPDTGLPSFVSINGPSFGGGFLGAPFGPFVMPKGGQAPENLAYPDGVDRFRFERRLSMLRKIEQAQLAQTGDTKIDGRRKLYEKAVSLMQSKKVDAFDISAEPEAVRSKFGDTDFGRGCLTALRLVSSGVRTVEVVLDGWDTHQDNFGRTRKLMEILDPAMSALLTELAHRTESDGKSLLSTTMVVWMGDFGRTPKINAADGRDHFPQSSSVVLAGAGIRSGQAYGATDAEGAKVVSGAITVPNLMATLATPLGLDAKELHMTPIGRPIATTDAGVPVMDLLAIT